MKGGGFRSTRSLESCGLLTRSGYDASRRFWAPALEWIDWAPADLFEGMPRCEGGAFRISDRPGHGIALTSDAEKKYRLS